MAREATNKKQYIKSSILHTEEKFHKYVAVTKILQLCYFTHGYYTVQNTLTYVYSSVFDNYPCIYFNVILTNIAPLVWYSGVHLVLFSSNFFILDSIWLVLTIVYRTTVKVGEYTSTIWSGILVYTCGYDTLILFINASPIWPNMVMLKNLLMC